MEVTLQMLEETHDISDKQKMYWACYYFQVPVILFNLIIVEVGIIIASAFQMK